MNFKNLSKILLIVIIVQRQHYVKKKHKNKLFNLYQEKINYKQAKTQTITLCVHKHFNNKSHYYTFREGTTKK